MRRLAYVLLALIWVAGLVIWLRHTPAAPPPKPPEPSVPALDAPPPVGGKLEAVAAPRKPAPVAPPRHRKRLIAATGEPRPALVRVRSSVGLPLLSVEVSVAGEEWERVDLPANGLEVEAEAYPLRIRAAGHLEADAPRSAREIVLEPDALLTVESANLRTRVHGLATLQHSRLLASEPEFQRSSAARKSGLLAEFPDANHLLVAFSPARLAANYCGDVDVSFGCADGRPVEFTLHPIAGLRAHYVLPLDELVSSAPLDVEIVDESERPGYIRLWIEELAAVRGGGSRLDFPWGTVAIGDLAPPAFPDPIWGRPNRTRLAALALYRSYALRATDENDRYGRIEFVHDGSERRIVLQAPYTVVGRVVDAETRAGLVWPDLRSHPLGEPEDLEWFARGAATQEEGRFELHLPGMRWGMDGCRAALEAPERFTLVASAEGHCSAELEFAWDGKRRVDVGEIALARNLRPIVIEPNELVLSPWTDLDGFTFGDEPQWQWTLRHVIHRTEEGNELELAFGGGSQGGESRVMCWNLVSGEITARPFVAQLGELLLLGAGGEALAFRRGELGHYHQIPRTLHNVTVQCAKLPEAGVWTLGWRGGGTWAGFRIVNKHGEVAAGLALPEIATELWWSAGEAPPELCKRQGGALALSNGPQSLVLR